ncbi:MAG: chemotaxis protein CheC [Oscillospiraceae bacterium]|nr:chemotaxis protein CheC [Oscillospiraceae bacterium]
MRVDYYFDLNESHRDILMELGNIGTSNALTALSQLTSHPIKMDLPRIRIVPANRLPEYMDYEGARNTGVIIEVHGDLECVVTFLLNEVFTKVIAEELTGEPLAQVNAMSEMQESAIREVGNIMCNAYLNALASMLETELTVSLPDLEIGSCAKILGAFSQEFADNAPEILFIENTFYYLGQEVVSYILLQPKLDTLQKILHKLS